MGMCGSQNRVRDDIRRINKQMAASRGPDLKSVWIVLKQWSYDESEVLGVYADEDDAHFFVSKEKRETGFTYVVEDHEIRRSTL